jgi:hypothetical protein
MNKVLTSEFPESGTAARGMMAGLAFANPATAAKIAVGAAPYTAPGQWMVNQFFAPRPQAMENLASTMRAFNPYASAAAPASFGGLFGGF